MNCCYVIGALNCDLSKLNTDSSDMIIAADAGLNNLKSAGITPDLIVGDFDSLDYVPEGNNVIVHPVKKNETDTILAIDIGLSKGYRAFKIYGCIGGRLDHTIANIQTAAYVSERAANAVFIGDNECFTVIKDGYIEFSAESRGMISVFANSSVASGVTESGLLYEISEQALTPDYPLGVSNEFIGKPSRISVNNGKLCVMWSDTEALYTIGG